LLSSSKPDYIAEYVGYKVQRAAAIRATPQVRRAGLFADNPPRTSWPSGIISRRTREARGIPSSRSPEIMGHSADAKASAACYEFKVAVGSISY